MKDKLKEKMQNDFQTEFGIHFQNLEELQFAKEFTSEVIDKARKEEREEQLEQARIILMRVIKVVEKEHGSKNVYFDMVEDLFTEEIEKELKTN